MRPIFVLLIAPLFAALLFAADEDPPTGPLKTLPAGGAAFTGVLKVPCEKMALSADGSRLAVTGTGAHILIFDASTLKLIKDFDAAGVSGSIDFSGDGKEVLTAGGGNTVQLWNLETGKATRQFMGHAAEVHAVAVSPDGSRVASTDGAGTLRIWDFNDGKGLFTLTGKKYPDDQPTEDIVTEGLAFSPDGRFIVTEANDVKARVWDANLGVELRMIPDHDGSTASVSISPSGALAATTRGGAILRIWRLDSGEIVRSITGHDGDLTCSVFAPDEFTIFTGAQDSTVRQWDVETGLELRRFKLTLPVTALAVSADGKRLFSLSADAGIVAWDVHGLPQSDEKTGVLSSIDAAWVALGSGDYNIRSEAVLYFLTFKDQAAAVKFLTERLTTESSSEDDHKTQNDLIAKLDDPSYAVRLKAAEELKKLGHAARETLRLAVKNPSSEVRSRAALLLREIGGAIDGRGALILEIFGLMHSPGSKEALAALAATPGPQSARAKALLARGKP